MSFTRHLIVGLLVAMMALFMFSGCANKSDSPKWKGETYSEEEIKKINESTKPDTMQNNQAPTQTPQGTTPAGKAPATSGQ